MKGDSGNESLHNVLDELRCINRIIDKICRVRETNHIMSIIIDELTSATGADQGVINLISPSKEAELVTIVRKDTTSENEIPYKVNSLLTGWVLKESKFLKIDDLDSDERFKGLSSEKGRFKSILCFPMIVRGEIIGLTSLVKSAQNGLFSDDNCRLTGIVVSQSAQILSNAFLMEELARNNELLEISKEKLQNENVRLKVELGTSFSFENIVGNSRVLKDVLTLASKVSTNDSPLLVTGPTGTGKELMAHAIHFNSFRKDKPFVVKNCGIKTESLLEAELFGYTKGAFTGADKNKPGLFKEADGGTIFLDEIGDAPLSTQMAILRVLENGEIRPVGASKTEFVDVRVISATNRDLKKKMEDGSFRQDLFYRLNTFTIELPSLQQRREDIPLLAQYFLKKLKTKFNNDNLSFSPTALDFLTKYSWPGNIRQLENEIERAAVTCNSDTIEKSDFSREVFDSALSPSDYSLYRGPLKSVVENVEKDIISATLLENNGNIMRTSKILGLTRKGLKDKISRYDIKFEKE
ncbi:MAG: GAF domain-containing protein [candidate division Zixibacteria bacterium]|nr:GAF domain-containing protein [candidate division Zixibacteria bacterium]